MTATHTATQPVPTSAVAHHPSLTAPGRLRLTGRGVTRMVTSLLAIPLCVLWATFVALSPLTVLAPAALLATALVRRYADAHRRDAAHVLGTPVPWPYRTRRPGLRGLVDVVRDPASWRDLAWLFVKPVVGFITAALPVVLLLGAVFYAIFPFLYAITPRGVFDQQFGFVPIDTVARSFACMLIAPVALALWWVVTPALARADARMDAALLRPVR